MTQIYSRFPVAALFTAATQIVENAEREPRSHGIAQYVSREEMVMILDER